MIKAVRAPTGEGARGSERKSGAGLRRQSYSAAVVSVGASLGWK
jgi:hypothetical protein